ncbi:MAG: hypothetical protein IT269_01445 [Saprospiraceae bacterium]|nr:hypothetical protein [Saprospiraceae bacterium]
MKIIPSVLRLSLVAAILFLALQCRKNDQITTSVSGRVYDRVTGEPIEGAKLDFIVVGPQYESENEILEHKYLTTTENGIYETSYTGNDDNQLNHWTTTLPGYLTLVTVSGIEQNKHNKLDFEMIPIDGKIILTVKHLQSNKDSLTLLHNKKSHSVNC